MGGSSSHNHFRRRLSTGRFVAHRLGTDGKHVKSAVMYNPLSTPVAPVIGASAMLAYLFVPFKSGSKAPVHVIAATFGASLAVVTTSSLFYYRLCNTKS